MATKRSSINWKNLPFFNTSKKDKSGEIGEKIRHRINEILKKGKTNETDETTSYYKKGQEVNIPRSDGRITKAFIAHYNFQTGEYRVERRENGSGYYKILTKEDLDIVNPKKSEYDETQNIDETTSHYKKGQEVNIPRSDGRITKAFIAHYNFQTGEYRVERRENGSGYYKILTKEDLDIVNPKKSEHDETQNTDETDENRDNYIVEPEILYTIMDKKDINTFKNLKRGNDEEIYINMFGEPKNIVNLGNGKNLYTTNCLINDDRKYIVGYIRKGNQIRLRLFYRSKSEGARRSCPGLREEGGYSKGANIPNSSYETTTRIPHNIEYRFDCLPEEHTDFDPIIDPADYCGIEILEKEMSNEIHIEKIYKEYSNDTCDSFIGKSSSQVKNMYKKLGKNFDLKKMIFLEGEGYTYEHQYLGTIEVQPCRLNNDGEDIDFYFAKAKNDPLNRVRIEQLTYADANITSFGINNKQINAAPLTGKPIDYSTQVPYDMRNNARINGSNYIDIRELYQDNPLIKRFKKESEKYNKKFS